MEDIADQFLAFAQPLFDTTDGSEEEMKKAVTIGNLCWNLAVMPKERGTKLLAEMREVFKMNEVIFEQFLTGVVLPMLDRHRKMYPEIHDQKRGWLAVSVATDTLILAKYSLFTA